MRLVPNVIGVASAPEGTIISLSCISVNQVLIGVNNATCVGGVWSPDIDGVMCRGKFFSMTTIIFMVYYYSRRVWVTCVC